MANCPMYGEDVQLHWLLENLRSENKNLKFNLCAQIITYSGCPMDQFWKDSVNVTLGPREGKKVNLSNTLLSTVLFRRLFFFRISGDFLLVVGSEINTMLNVDS